MPQVPGRRVAALVLALATVAVCVAGSSVASGVVRSYFGAPHGAVDKAVPGLAYAVRDDAGHLLVVTFESSTCPVHVAQVRSVGANGVRVTLSRIRDTICTADARMRTTVLNPPAGVDLQRRTTVQIETVRQVLPGR